MAKTPVIAIVDDDEGVRTSLASLVRSLGYEARTYGSGDDFLRQPPGEDPACMITDIQMPAMSGADLLVRVEDVDKANEALNRRQRRSH